MGFLALTYSDLVESLMAAFGFTLVAALYAVALLIVICQPGLWLPHR